MTTKAEFDEYADDYAAGLGPALVLSGETKEYFARRRIAWTSQYLKKQNRPVNTVLDFGCGTGTATPFFFELLNAQSVVGVDTSSKSLDVARREYGSDRVQFRLLDEYEPNEQFDLVYCNGVFHHIPPPDRRGAAGYVYRSLRPDGFFALWENNAWNPISRLLMYITPLDRNAIPMTPSETRRLVCSTGFKVLGTDFLFIFPKMLRWLRSKEHLLARLPFGLQYQVLATKPVAGANGRP
jgi:SAM-dependent methyltransferase